MLHTLTNDASASPLFGGAFASIKRFQEIQSERMAKAFAESTGTDTRQARPMVEDAEELIDDAVVRVGLDRLTVMRRVMERGLVYNLPNWLSVLELSHDRISRFGSAVQTLTPHTHLEKSNPDRDKATIPIYATMEGGEIGIRTLLASQRAGSAFDTTLIEEYVRNVNEANEDQAISGSTLTLNGNNAPGLINAPNVNTWNFIDGESWTAAGHSGEDILADVLAGADELEQDNFFGPYELFIPTAYGNEINKDFKTNSDKTTRQRLEELEFGGENLVVTVADLMPTDTIALVTMRSNVLDVVLGQGPTSISWTIDPGWQTKIAVVACSILRTKDTYDGTSGIAIGTPT
jgi:hypothetical protein